MSVTIAPETEQLLREQVEAGRYSSTEEALTEAVRLLVERERRKAELGDQVQASIDQIERGEFTEYTEHEIDKLFDEIQEEAMERLRTEQ
ncbi:MAG: type II toxin-antitoxin system ParD family antitoxin [Acidobacteria bacterium]|nr:type II toxin-antitoxin system ParD family antitoxin [Acidobacteriota bacterium]